MKLIEQILRFIDMHIAEVTPEQVILQSHYSDFHFYRMFSKWTGMSLKAYITKRKLDHIFYEASEASLNGLAYEYGFETYSGFYKACKRCFGMAPKKYLSNAKHMKPKLIVERRYPMVSENRVKNILKQWNLENRDVSGVFNENGQKRKDLYLVNESMYFYVHQSKNKIENAINLNDALNQVGIKMPKFIETSSGKKYYEDGLYYSLIEKLDQQTLNANQILDNRSNASLIGAAVGKFHLATETLDQVIVDEDNLYKTCLEWAIPTMDKHDEFIHDFIKVYDDFEEGLKGMKHQIIHRNMHLYNIFINQKQVIGYGDLHLTVKSARMFDLAYLLTSILAAPELIDRDKWLKMYPEIINAYHEVNPISDIERLNFKYVLYSVQLIFIAYFKSMGDHDDLAEKNYDLLKWLFKALEAA